MVHAPQPLLQQMQCQAPKVDRPTLCDNIGQEQWNSFKKGWDMFVQANGVSEADQAVQLFACCDIDLRSKVTCTDDDIFHTSYCRFSYSIT